MSNIEIQIEALRRCVPNDAYEKALAELQGEAPPTKNTPCNAEELIQRVIMDLAVPAHIKGHPYIVRTIELLIDNPDLINHVTGELYPTIAKEFNTTASRVERAIRHAIEVAWGRGDVDVQMEYFGNTVSPSLGKPTNSEFLAQVANVIRRKLKYGK